MEDSSFIDQVEQCLLHSESKWNTSQGILSKMGNHSISPIQLDELLLNHYKNSKDQKFRFSTLPSRKSLDVLWGHLDRVNKKEVIDIYKQNEELLIDELDRTKEKSIFLSHSFKDSDQVVKLAKDLAQEDLHIWLAETDLLYRQHINFEVQNAIWELPYFGVYLSENIFNSLWTAKEIDFAITHKKKIIGFLDEEFSNYLKGITIESHVAKDIYRRFFDNHHQVIFVNLSNQLLRSSEEFPLGEIINLEELNEILK